MTLEEIELRLELLTIGLATTAAVADELAVKIRYETVINQNRD